MGYVGVVLSGGIGSEEWAWLWLEAGIGLGVDGPESGFGFPN